ncbi:MAG: nucleoside triphosphate pyrophosphohydrolase [Clostridia bacterium]|nr:nucleoside triphosphate pyrophosphohydrolase [Clostridia bacterium]
MVELNVAESTQKLGIEHLIEIMKVLRSPEGCPWDREQTHKSIRNEVLEEAYEVCDAIDNEDADALCEELGDLLLQVAFHATIAAEKSDFDFKDVTDGICRKLIFRHPHVFKDAKADNSAQVLDLWDEVKRQEKHQTTYTDTLTSVPKAFPALMRAAKVEKRGFKGGIEIDNSPETLLDSTEELKKAIEKGDKLLTERVYGDLLFKLASLQRTLGINSEQALNDATERFIKDFEDAEKRAQMITEKPTPTEIGQAFGNAK